MTYSFPVVLESALPVLHGTGWYAFGDDAGRLARPGANETGEPSWILVLGCFALGIATQICIPYTEEWQPDKLAEYLLAQIEEAKHFYTCGHCKEIKRDDRPLAEAEAEMRATFGDLPPHARVRICEQCLPDHLLHCIKIPGTELIH